MSTKPDDTLTRMTRDDLGPDARPAESFDELYRRKREEVWAHAEPVTVYTTNLHRGVRSHQITPWWPLLSDDDVGQLETIRLDLVRAEDLLRSKGGGKFSIDIYPNGIEEVGVHQVATTPDGAMALLAERARADAATHRDQAERLDRIAQLVEARVTPVAPAEDMPVQPQLDNMDVAKGGGELGTVRITYRAPGEARSTGGAGGDGYEPVDPLATGLPPPYEHDPEPGPEGECPTCGTPGPIE